MSNNKSSFRQIYCLNVKLNNHVFIIINAHAILLNIDFPLSRLIFKEITYIQPFILKDKLISTREVTLVTYYFN